MTDDEILNLICIENQVESGFRHLMSKYQEKIYWHIRRIVLDHEEANDVVQNTFIKVYKHIAKFERKSKLYTWLYRIATNEAITHKNKQRNNYSLDDEEGQIANKLKADEYFDGSEIQTQLYAAIELLPDKQRVVFQMRYFDELSYRDLSEVLQTSEGALKASFHHAVKKIETYFKQLSV